MSAHSPGPWRLNLDPDDPGYESAEVLDARGVPIAFVRHDEGCLEGGEARDFLLEQEANARLVVAAPDLLALVRDLATARGLVAVEALQERARGLLEDLEGERIDITAEGRSALRRHEEKR